MLHKIAMPLESAGPDGIIVLTFPDNGAGPGYAGMVEHLRLLADLDPTHISELMGSAEGAALVGAALIIGVDTSNLMERWEDVVRASPVRLSKEQRDNLHRFGSVDPERVPAPKDEVVHEFERAIVESKLQQFLKKHKRTPRNKGK